MKIRVGRVVRGDCIGNFESGLWTVSSWLLTNQSLEQSLRERAWAAVGIPLTEQSKYFIDVTFEGPTKWVYVVKIYPDKWEEVTE